MFFFVRKSQKRQKTKEKEKGKEKRKTGVKWERE